MEKEQADDDGEEDEEGYGEGGAVRSLGAWIGHQGTQERREKKRGRTGRHTAESEECEVPGWQDCADSVGSCKSEILVVCTLCSIEGLASGLYSMQDKNQGMCRNTIVPSEQRL